MEDSKKNLNILDDDTSSTESTKLEVIHLRLVPRLKSQFYYVCEKENRTPSKVLRMLIMNYTVDKLHKLKGN